MVALFDLVPRPPHDLELSEPGSSLKGPDFDEVVPNAQESLDLEVPTVSFIGLAEQLAVFGDLEEVFKDQRLWLLSKVGRVRDPECPLDAPVHGLGKPHVKQADLRSVQGVRNAPRVAVEVEPSECENHQALAPQQGHLLIDKNRLLHVIDE